MHIAEGFLPVAHAAGWAAASAPFVVYGLRSIRKAVRDNPERKMLLAVCAAFAFVLSALKLPSVTGSCSHPTGVGLGAVLFGPAAVSVLGMIVLLFQAILLAHGGLTTLGANTFSMAVAGPIAAYWVYRSLRRLGTGLSLSVFAAAALGDLVTYLVTSVQLALAFPDPASGFAGALLKFGGIFAITQVPLALSEGLLTVLIMNVLSAYNSGEFQELISYRKG